MCRVGYVPSCPTIEHGHMLPCKLQCCHMKSLDDIEIPIFVLLCVCCPKVNLYRFFSHNLFVIWRP